MSAVIKSFLQNAGGISCRLFTVLMVVSILPLVGCGDSEREERQKAWAEESRRLDEKQKRRDALNQLCDHHEDLASKESVSACLQLAREGGRWFKTLMLYDRGITELPDEFHGLEHVTDVYLANNELTDLPPSFALMKNVEELTLSHNKFTTLPVSLMKLDGLKALRVDNNKLTHIPESIKNMRSLEWLSVVLNPSPAMPDTLSEMHSLTHFDLSLSGYREIPNAIFSLPNIHYLGFENNQLVSLPEAIGNLKSLRGLGLAENKLRELPAEVGGLEGLIFLDLRGNQLERVTLEIEALHNLTREIEGHSIVGGAVPVYKTLLISDSFDLDYELKRAGIDLRRNRLESISEQFCRVKYLYIDDNPLKKEDFENACRVRGKL